MKIAYLVAVTVGAITLYAAPQACAQTKPEKHVVGLGIMSPDNRCPKEPTSFNIDPEIVDCHAAFAPLPVIPLALSRSTPEERRVASDWLLAQLRRSEVCGTKARTRVREACAIIIYTLPLESRLTGIPLAEAAPWTRIEVIYRVRGNLIYTVNSNKLESIYGGPEKPVWLLLAARQMDRCKEGKTVQVGTSVSSSGWRPDSCRELQVPAVHVPKLLLLRSEAERVLNDKLIKKVFDAPPYAVNACPPPICSG